MRRLIAPLLVLCAFGIACTPPPPPPTPFGTCYDNVASGNDLQVGQVETNLNWFWNSTDGTCTGTVTGRNLIVTADDWPTAYAKCAGFQYAGLLTGSGGWTMPTPPSWFVCFTL